MCVGGGGGGGGGGVSGPFDDSRNVFLLESSKWSVAASNSTIPRMIVRKLVSCYQIQQNEQKRPSSGALNSDALPSKAHFGILVPNTTKLTEASEFGDPELGRFAWKCTFLVSWI